MRKFVLLLAAAVSISGGARAATFTNGSFELPDDVGQNAVTANYLPGWTHGGTGQEYHETNGDFGIDAADGTHWVDFGGNGTTGGTLSQTFDTVLNATYTVNYQYRLQQGFDTNTGLRVSVSTGQSVDAITPLVDSWGAGPSLVFTGTGSPVTLTFTDITVGGFSSNIGLDAVTLTSDAPGGVPEPATWAMMVAGFGLMGAAVRGRGKYTPASA